MKRAARGLTLLELVIMLAVLVVLGTLSVPTIGARLARQRLDAAAEQLAADLANARFEAARRGQVLHLQTSAGTDWCWAVATTADCGCAAIQACQLQRVPATAHRGVRLVAGWAARLEPAGTSEPTSVATFESGHGDRLRVDLLALGRARICSAAGPTNRYPAC
jgi:type IV fimbrial biogenesis protein FimT